MSSYRPWSHYKSCMHAESLVTVNFTYQYKRLWSILLQKLCRYPCPSTVNYPSSSSCYYMGTRYSVHCEIFRSLNNTEGTDWWWRTWVIWKRRWLVVAVSIRFTQYLDVQWKLKPVIWCFDSSVHRVAARSQHVTVVSRQSRAGGYLIFQLYMTLCLWAAVQSSYLCTRYCSLIRNHAILVLSSTSHKLCGTSRASLSPPAAELAIMTKIWEQMIDREMMHSGQGS